MDKDKFGFDVERALQDWRSARDRVVVATVAAEHAGLIAELAPLDDGAFMLTWAALSDEERERVLTYKRLGQDVLEPVCRLCGTTFDDARAAKLGDSPGARAQARREMVL